MKIEGGLIIILMLGALGSLSALSIPGVGGGADVKYDVENGVTLTETSEIGKKSSSTKDTGSRSHSEDDGYVKDSQHLEKQQNVESSKSSGKNEINFGGTKNSKGITKKKSSDSKQTNIQYDRVYENTVDDESSGDSKSRRKRNAGHQGNTNHHGGSDHQDRNNHQDDNSHQYGNKHQGGNSHQYGNNLQYRNNHQDGNSHQYSNKHQGSNSHQYGNNHHSGNNRNEESYGSEQGHTRNDNGYYNEHGVHGNRKEQRNYHKIGNGQYGSQNDNYNLHGSRQSESEQHGMRSGNYRSGNNNHYSENGNYRTDNGNHYSGKENNGVNRGHYRTGNNGNPGREYNEGHHGSYRSGHTNRYSGRENHEGNREYKSNELSRRGQRSGGSYNRNYEPSNGNNKYGSSHHNSGNYDSNNNGYYKSSNMNSYSNRGKYGNSHERYRSGGGNYNYGKSSNANQHSVNRGSGNLRSNNYGNSNRYSGISKYDKYQTYKRNYGSGNRNINYGDNRKGNIGSYRKNYGSEGTRYGNSGLSNRNRNYGYGNRNYGSGHHKYTHLRRGYSDRNNAYTRPYEYQNGYHQVNTDQYRQGVKHEDVLKYLSNKGRRVPDRDYGDDDNDYRASGGILRGCDFNNVVDNTRYTTGNGRYVLKPGKNGEKHSYYDTETGNYHDTHTITLHTGDIVIIPGNFINSTTKPEKESDDDHNGCTKKNPHEDGLLNLHGCYPFKLGPKLVYLGDGTYKCKGKIIPSSDIIEYCEKHNIKESFTKDGFPDVLFNDELEGVLGSHGKFPLDCGNGIYYLGWNHYRCNDEIVPACDMPEYLKINNLDTSILRDDGLPTALFEEPLSSLNPIDNENCSEDLSPVERIYGIFPCPITPDLLYLGEGNYKYKDEIIPSSQIVEYCKSNDIKGVSFTDNGYPDFLEKDTFNHTFPIDVGPDIQFLGHGHYKCGDKIIPASNITDYIQENNLNIPLNEHGIPHAVLDKVLGSVTEPDVDQLLDGIHGNYPYPVGDDLLYLGDGNYKCKDEIIPSSEIVEYCKSNDIKNVSFTDDGYPGFLVKDTFNDTFPIDVGPDIKFLGHGHYKCGDKIVPASNITEYTKERNLDVPCDENGIPHVVLDKLLGSVPEPHEKELLDEVYGIFPFLLGSDLSYLGNGNYKYKDETIPCSEIVEYCKLHDINEISLTEDGYPGLLFQDTFNGIFPIDVGPDIKFLGKGHYKCGDKIVPASDIDEYIKKLDTNIVCDESGIAHVVWDKVFGNVLELDDLGTLPYPLGHDLSYCGNGTYIYKNKTTINSSKIIEFCELNNLKIPFTKDGLPLDFVKKDSGPKSEENDIIDVGTGLFYYLCGNDTISSNKISEYCKDNDITHKTFHENCYPKPSDDEPSPSSNKSSNCPEGPIDCGEGITYIGDCNYMYQDHIIEAKYILGLISILQAHDVHLPVGPNDDYNCDEEVLKDTSTTKDLGYGVCYDKKTKKYKYNDREFEAPIFLDVLEILGLKFQPENPGKLIKDDSRTENSDADILKLIDELLAYKYGGSTAEQPKDTTDSDKKNDSSNGGPKKPVKDGQNDKDYSDDGYSSSSSSSSRSSSSSSSRHKEKTDGDDYNDKDDKPKGSKDKLSKGSKNTDHDCDDKDDTGNGSKGKSSKGHIKTDEDGDDKDNKGKGSKGKPSKGHVKTDEDGDDKHNKGKGSKGKPSKGHVKTDEDGDDRDNKGKGSKGKPSKRHMKTDEDDDDKDDKGKGSNGKPSKGHVKTDEDGDDKDNKGKGSKGKSSKGHMKTDDDCDDKDDKGNGSKGKPSKGHMKTDEDGDDKDNKGKGSKGKPSKGHVKTDEDGDDKDNKGKGSKGKPSKGHVKTDEDGDDKDNKGKGSKGKSSKGHMKTDDDCDDKDDKGNGSKSKPSMGHMKTDEDGDDKDNKGKGSKGKPSKGHVKTDEDGDDRDNKSKGSKGKPSKGHMKTDEDVNDEDNKGKGSKGKPSKGHVNTDEDGDDRDNKN